MFVMKLASVLVCLAFLYQLSCTSAAAVRSSSSRQQREQLSPQLLNKRHEEYKKNLHLQEREEDFDDVAEEELNHLQSRDYLNFGGFGKQLNQHHQQLSQQRASRAQQSAAERKKKTADESLMKRFLFGTSDERERKSELVERESRDYHDVLFGGSHHQQQPYGGYGSNPYGERERKSELVERESRDYHDVLFGGSHQQQQQSYGSYDPYGQFPFFH